MGILEGIINFFTKGEDEPTVRDLGRNESCWCGSGRKYKKCCLDEDQKKTAGRYAAKCKTR